MWSYEEGSRTDNAKKVMLAAAAAEESGNIYQEIAKLESILK